MRMTIGTHQIRFGFIDEIDNEMEEREHYERKMSFLKFYQYHYERFLKDMPPNETEQKYVDMGIRMSRHVNGLECHECDYDTTSHCPPDFPEMWDAAYKTYYPMKVCVRDWFGWCVEQGIVPENYPGCHPEMRKRIKASIERRQQGKTTVE